MLRANMNRITLIVAFTLGSVNAQSATVTVTVDITAAVKMAELFERDQVSRNDVAELLGMPAVRATIAQTQRFDRSATEEIFVDSLWAVVRNQNPTGDPFNFINVRERLSGIRLAIVELSKNQSTVTRHIRDSITRYVPTTLDIETTLYATLGGTSDGWAPGNGDFYVALHYFENDIPGLTSMVTHEVYHVAQQSFMLSFHNIDSDDAAKNLTSNMIVEGSATMVGKPTNYDGSGNYLNFLQKKHTRNLSRMSENFALFEALYFRAANDPTVAFDQFYSLGFSGEWDSPLYFVGLHIAEGLDKHLGPEALVALLEKKTGTEILAQYVSAYTTFGDSNLIQFSPPIEAIIRESVTVSGPPVQD